MTLYTNDVTDPRFNLASEEYLIDNLPGDAVMLWRNEPSVIIGRSQNAYAEIDRGYIETHGIKVVRRLSGGGAVFHDLGNVNYTFIVDEGKDGNALDFGRFIAPVIEALAELGIDAEMSGRNDIVVGGVKISGTAQCHRNGRLLHHGTLLYSADLGRLAGALRVNEEKLKSKGVASVRSRVGNLRELCGLELDVTEFMAHLQRSLAASAQETVPLTGRHAEAIRRLAEEKYGTWEWNWGESRSFDRTRRHYYPYGLVEVGLTAERGVISACSITGDFFGVREISELCEALIGLRLERAPVLAALENIGDYISGAKPEDIAALII
ncbi:MAG: lipoate--protein ligase [Clostridiales bacterium]|nr:lipoate--protein ligase [Clostridiales bacterium]